jgi:hypothetical protein
LEFDFFCGLCSLGKLCAESDKCPGHDKAIREDNTVLLPGYLLEFLGPQVLDAAFAPVTRGCRKN